MKIVFQNKILLFILLFAAVLRFSGIRYSYPPYHADEGMSYSQGISIIKEKTLDAHGYSLAYAYPSLVPIVNALFFKYIFIPIKWTSYWVNNLDKVIDGYIKIPLSEIDYDRTFQLEILGARDINALKWGRMIAAFFGVGVVFLSYLLSKEIFNKKTGLIVASLVAMNYRQVLNSHINLPDIYNAFFLILSIIFSYRIIKKPNIRSYLYAGIFAGLSFSVKFHIYSFISLIFSHFFSIKQSSFKDFVKCFLGNKKFYASLLLAAVIIMVINPYQIINIEKTIELLNGVAGKYRVGRNRFDFYPYSYLYHIGIGRLAFILSGIGVLLAIVKKTKPAIILLSAVVSFFFVVTYYTGGGFYTRNFVTIIPLVLIFAGYLLASILNIKNKTIGLIIFLIAMLFIAKESLSNSIVVAKEYRSIWNIEIISNWISNNIPEGNKVAAHPSVLIPVKDVEVIPYNFDDGPFSLEEFKELGADFIVTNLDWVTVNFYGWMAQDTAKSLEYWDKPIDLLEKDFSAMAIREISDFAIYWVLNPWQAPDSSFVVAKVPKYKVNQKELVERFDFSLSQDVWKSKPIKVNDWNGYVVDYKTVGEGRDYVYLSFYEELHDVEKIDKRVAVRLSSRDQKESLMGKIPKGANYMTIGFESYNSYKAMDYLEELILYKANVDVDFSGFDIKGVKIDEGIIFPNSHGNL